MRPSDRRMLLGKTLVRLLTGILALGVLVFLPAGTLDYWQAWLYMIVLFMPLMVVTVILYRTDPDLLARRQRLDEAQPTQRLAIAAASAIFLGVFVISGFDRRYGWSSVPPWLVVVADLGVLVGYGLFFLTMRENRYASRVIEVQPGQRVIRTGPYAYVRHPMYAGAILMLIATAPALGSYWGLLAAVLLPAALVLRIRNEETLLGADLPGYKDYCEQVRYRLLPFIW